MIIIDFGVTSFSWKAGIMFGDAKQCELKTLRLGLVTFTFMSNNAQNMLVSAMSGLSRDKDWLVNNAPSVRHAKRRAIAQARAADSFSYKAQCEDYSDKIFKLDEKVSRLTSQNNHLKQAIKIVSGGEAKGLEG